MNIEVSEQWANAITSEHRFMREALERIAELTKGRGERRLRQIHEVACLALGTLRPSPQGPSPSEPTAHYPQNGLVEQD